MSNFVPNETKRFVPRDPPWINKPLKRMLNRKNRLYKNYKGIVTEKRTKLGWILFVANVNWQLKMPNYLI